MKTKMPIDDFEAKLLALGFTKFDDVPLHSSPWVRSFDPPASLRSAIIALNIGGSSLEDYSVMVQGLDYKEWGDEGDCNFGGVMKPDEALLAALASGAEGFTKWFGNRVAFSFDVNDDEGNTAQGVRTADGKVHIGSSDVN